MKKQSHQRTIGIIGGKGLMGSFLAGVFKAAGLRVIVSDVGTRLTNAEVVKQSDIILFSVPIHKTQKIIRAILPFTRRDQLLLDCTSIKSMPIAEMKKGRAQVIGLHPMFRPTPLGLTHQTIVMCPARASKDNQNLIKKIFSSGGARVIQMTARQHDKLMSVIQVLLHFHTIVLGHAMRKLAVPIRKTLQVASPIYRLEMDMIGRIFSQDPMLYGPIEMLNPETSRVIRTLLAETKELAKIVNKKDLNEFAKLFNQTSKFLGSYKKEAMEEINKLMTKF